MSFFFPDIYGIYAYPLQSNEVIEDFINNGLAVFFNVALGIQMKVSCYTSDNDSFAFVKDGPHVIAPLSPLFLSITVCKFCATLILLHDPGCTMHLLHCIQECIAETHVHL